MFKSESMNNFPRGEGKTYPSEPVARAEGPRDPGAQLQEVESPGSSANQPRRTPLSSAAALPVQAPSHLIVRVIFTLGPASE